MSDAGIIAVVVNRAYLEGGFLLTKSAFYPPQPLLGSGHFRGRQIRVGDQHELASQSPISFYGFLIDGDTAFGKFQEWGIAFVPHHGLRPFVGDDVLKLSQDCLSIFGILFGLFGIEADHIATTSNAHCFRLKVRINLL